MSGGSHPQHGRVPPVAPTGPPTWNHLQVPTFFAGRQPQHAHMSSEHSLLTPRPPTWHTPSTEGSTPLFSLQQMLGDRGASLGFPRPVTTSVDLSLPLRSTNSPRNGSQNGETTSPISLSVRDAKQINSLAERRQGNLQDLINPKRPKRVDTILERLNPSSSSSVIVTAAHSSHDESSNGSQPSVMTSSPLPREEDVVSPVSNEDSLDSAKSRRKRKPSKTVRMSKEDCKASDDEQPSNFDDDLLNLSKGDASESVDLTKTNLPLAEKLTQPIDVNSETLNTDKSPVPSKRRPSVSEDLSNNSSPSSSKTRRKTLSESETIENIAAMIASTEHVNEENKSNQAVQLSNAESENKINLEKVLSNSPQPVALPISDTQNSKPSGSEISDNNHSNGQNVLNTDEQSGKFIKGTTNFVEVENQLEKMFAGLDEADSVNLISTRENQGSYEKVTSTSSEVINSSGTTTPVRKKAVSARKSKSQRSSDINDTKKQNVSRKLNDESLNSDKVLGKGTKNKKANLLYDSSKNTLQKIKIKSCEQLIKDVYLYDSGSNASSNRSRGPFIQIRGPRDSPISVSIVNAPINDDDAEKTQRTKSKKSFHDDSEYRHKVRSKGLHSSTLSMKYDAHTTDTSWICVFCKRGPHTNTTIFATQPGTSASTNLPLCEYSSGDLFGPYVITSECPEYQQSLEDLRENTHKKLLRNEFAAYGGKFSNKKAKRRHLQGTQSAVSSLYDTPLEPYVGEALFGMLEAGPNKYEIWAHEDCIVWGPGVYLAGPRIVGLEGAVWSCCSVMCEYCKRRGASVSCLVRSCGHVAHVCCAKQAGWSLDDETYKAYCQNHKKV